MSRLGDWFREAVGVGELQRQVEATETASTARLREITSAYDSQLLRVQQMLADYERIGAAAEEDENAESRLALIRDSRFLVEWHPDAWSAIQHHTGMAIGNSLDISIRPKNEEGEVDRENKELQRVFDAVYDAEDNEIIFTLSSLADHSDSFLTDGERPFALFVDGASGMVRVRPVNSTQIESFVTNPDDDSDIWFYKRVWHKSEQSSTGGSKRNVVYYRHWKLGNDERDFAVNWLFSEAGPGSLEDGDRLAVDGAGSDAYMVVLTMNTRKKRGNPMLKQAITWLRTHSGFVQDRATIVRNRATYLDEYTVTGGSRAVQAVRDKMRSSLATPSGGVFGGETNPAPAAGSSLIHNKAVTASQRSVETGADDAEKDARIFRAQVSAGVGVPIALLYMDPESSGNLNAIIELMRKSKHRWERYRRLWHDFLRSFATFVMRVNGVVDGTYVIDINSPPMIEDNLQDYTQAIREGKKEHLIPEREAARLYMDRVGSNNVDELLADLDAEKEERMAMLPVGGFAPGDEGDDDSDSDGDEGDGNNPAEPQERWHGTNDRYWSLGHAPRLPREDEPDIALIVSSVMRDLEVG